MVNPFSDRVTGSYDAALRQMEYFGDTILNSTEAYSDARQNWESSMVSPKYTLVESSAGLTTMTWDCENRLRTIQAPGGSVVTNTYGADGLRRKREEGANTVLFMWDGQRILRESDASYVTQALYSAALGDYGPMISQYRASGGTRLLHPDALGTIWNTRTTTAATTDSYTFDAFGVQLAVSGTTNNAHRYIGQQGYQTEPNLGLDYVRARWHRPSTGSWLSADPVPSEPRYQYVGGRPTVATDRGGRQQEQDPPWWMTSHIWDLWPRLSSGIREWMLGGTQTEEAAAPVDTVTQFLLFLRIMAYDPLFGDMWARMFPEWSAKQWRASARPMTASGCRSEVIWDAVQQGTMASGQFCILCDLLRTPRAEVVEVRPYRQCWPFLSGSRNVDVWVYEGGGPTPPGDWIIEPLRHGPGVPGAGGEWKMPPGHGRPQFWPILDDHRDRLIRQPTLRKGDKALGKRKDIGIHIDSNYRKWPGEPTPAVKGSKGCVAFTPPDVDRARPIEDLLEIMTWIGASQHALPIHVPELP